MFFFPFWMAGNGLLSAWFTANDISEPKPTVTVTSPLRRICNKHEDMKKASSHYIWMSRTCSCIYPFCITEWKYRRSGMNTSLRRSLKMKKFASFAWDMQIHTDRELSVNRPDIVIKDHAKWCFKVIHVSVPSDRNTWTNEIQRPWD